MKKQPVLLDVDYRIERNPGLHGTQLFYKVWGIFTYDDEDYNHEEIIFSLPTTDSMKKFLIRCHEFLERQPDFNGPPLEPAKPSFNIVSHSEALET